MSLTFALGGTSPAWFVFFGTLVFQLFVVFFYSFYWKYNVFFRFAEATYVGASMGVGLALYLNVIWNNGIVPILNGTDYYMIVACFLGFLFFTRLSTKYFWASRYPTAVMIGCGLPLLMIGLIGSTIIPNVALQANYSFISPVFWSPSSGGNFDSFVGTLMFLLVSYYFLWTLKSRRGFGAGAKSWLLRACRIAVMATFGSELGVNGLIPYSNLVYGRIWGLMQFVGIVPSIAHFTLLAHLSLIIRLL